MNQNIQQKLFLCGAAVFAALFLFSGVILSRQCADQKQSAEAFAENAALVQEEPKSPPLTPREEPEPPPLTPREEPEPPPLTPREEAESVTEALSAFKMEAKKQ